MRIKKIKEVAIYSTDLDVIETFYGEILGMELIGKVANRHVFFRVGAQVLLFFNPQKTKDDQQLPPHFAFGRQHIAFECGHDEYEEWKSHLGKYDIAITHVQKWKPDVESFYFEDPVGNILEILTKGLWD